MKTEAAKDIENAGYRIRYDAQCKKVSSIWICTEAPEPIGNVISTYDIHKTDIVGVMPDIPEYYDKLCVVMICLNDTQKSDNDFLNMMNILLSPTIPVKEMKRILENEYNISMNDGLGKEMDLKR